MIALVSGGALSRATLVNSTMPFRPDWDKASCSPLAVAPGMFFSFGIIRLRKLIVHSMPQVIPGSEERRGSGVVSTEGIMPAGTGQINITTRSPCVDNRSFLRAAAAAAHPGRKGSKRGRKGSEVTIDV